MSENRLRVFKSERDSLCYFVTQYIPKAYQAEKEARNSNPSPCILLLVTLELYWNIINLLLYMVKLFQTQFIIYHYQRPESWVEPKSTELLVYYTTTLGCILENTAINSHYIWTDQYRIAMM